MALMLAVALVVGARTPGGPPSDAERVESITSRVRCPTCRSQSVADSDSPAAVAIRNEVQRQVAAGQPDGAIESYLVDRFTADILLKPEAKGVGLLVWTLPVVGTAAVIAALTLVFVRRRRSQPRREVTDADRALVEEAMRR